MPELKQSDERPGYIRIKKPISWLNRPVKFGANETKDFLFNLPFDIADWKWGTALVRLTKVVASGAFPSNEARAGYALISKAIIAACIQIAREEQYRLHVITEEDQHQLAESIITAFEQLEFDIGPAFFEHPTDLPIFESLKTALREWLDPKIISQSSPDLKKAALERAVNKLSPLLKENLDIEYRNHTDVYKILEDKLSSPFGSEHLMEKAWRTHLDRIRREVYEDPLFGVEKFPVADVFIPLRAYYETEIERTESQSIPGRKDYQHHAQDVQLVKNITDLHQTLTDWVGGQDKNDGLRVIAGDPGSGKSTGARTWATDAQVQDQARVLFISLHLFNWTGELRQALEQYFCEPPWDFPTNPLDMATKEKPILLIFDGLDELPSAHESKLSLASGFVREVKRYLNKYNQDQRQLLALITGRTIIIQTQHEDFRNQRQVNYLLPYYVDKDKLGRIEDPHVLLNRDQRDLWWTKYGQASGQDFQQGMPQELKEGGSRLSTLTEQPLLNYLVAKARQAGRLRFDENTKINSIYHHLLLSVYNNDHNPDVETIIKRKLRFEQFSEIMEQIAVTAWHGQGRGTTLGQVRACCQRANLTRELDILQQGSTDDHNLVRLLASFYFRERGRHVGDDTVIEFTHKTFREYLTACQILRILQHIVDALGSPSPLRFDEKTALKYWIEVCGPVTIDPDLWAFIKDEVWLTNKDNPDIVKSWQATIIRLFDYVLLHGLPMEDLKDIVKFKEMERQAVNAEVALMAVLSACTATTNDRARISWPDHLSFRFWLFKVRSQRINPAQYFNNLELTKVDLNKADLYSAQLSGADLSGANLSQVNFFGADLRGADISGANLIQIDLRSADLRQADLGRACLIGADLSGAKLGQANLSQANLGSADLTNADLSQANLSQAELHGAFFALTGLSEADLCRADLSHAEIGLTDLSKANLRQANLESASLHGSYLTGADLSGTNLSGTDLATITVTYDQLTQVDSLFAAKNLDPKIESRLRQTHPKLFVEKKVATD